MRSLRSAREDHPLFVVLTAAVVVALDVAVKVIARALLPPDGVMAFPSLALRVVDNARGPFGLGPLWITILASVVVLVLLVRHSQCFTLHAPLRQAALGLVAGGGLANLGERVFFGHTTDLLVLGQRTALNLADLAILAGIVLLIPSALSRRIT